MECMKGIVLVEEHVPAHILWIFGECVRLSLNWSFALPLLATRSGLQVIQEENVHLGTGDAFVLPSLATGRARRTAIVIAIRISTAHRTYRAAFCRFAFVD
jgi:hypothetical protein